MSTKDLVEDWIQIRATLQRQVRVLESGDMGAGEKALGSSTEATINRLRAAIAEFTDLLKEFGSADRP